MQLKNLGQCLAQIFHFIERQYLTQIKYQIVKEIGCVDDAYNASIELWIKCPGHLFFRQVYYRRFVMVFF